jgi:hypothetical protein
MLRVFSIVTFVRESVVLSCCFVDAVAEGGLAKGSLRQTRRQGKFPFIQTVGSAVVACGVQLGSV